MRFVNVTDEQYAILHRLSEDTGQTIPEVIDTILDKAVELSELCHLQNLALMLAKNIIDDKER